MDPQYWNGTPAEVAGNTAFGFYDDDPIFVAEAKGFAKLAASQLGYAIVDIEIDSGHFYTNFENAISEYGAQVNYYNILNNFNYLIGQPINTNLRHRPISGNLSKVITLGKSYGSVVGAGGTNKWYSSSLNLITDVQDYDLNSVLPNGAEIQRIHHYDPPTVLQFYDPYSGMSGGLQNIANEFGWFPNGTNYILTPLYADVLRIQQLEFNAQIRKSAYSFELNGNVLSIFPIPKRDYTIWFDYIIKSERDNSFGFDDGTNTERMSDFSDINYQRPVYSQFNEPAKQWCRNYALALTKITLGNIRGKYATIPGVDGDITLDGATLRSEGALEKEALLTRLNTMLTEMAKTYSFENQKTQNDNVREILSSVPLGIWIA